MVQGKSVGRLPLLENPALAGFLRLPTPNIHQGNW